MKVEVYLCDNCRQSINGNQKYFYECFILHLCDRCKNKFDVFYNNYQEKSKKLKDEYKEQLKKEFPNLYEGII